MPASLPQDRRAGVLLALAGFALFPITDTLMKFLTRGYPLVETMFFNALFSVVTIGAYGLLTAGPAGLATRRPGLQLLRGLAGLGAGGGAFFAFTQMPLADVYAILFASPLIITALAGMLLGEPVGPKRWTAVAVGFMGVLLMLRPSGGGLMDIGAIAALASAVSYSLSGLIVRRWGRGETAAAFPFYGNLLVMALTGCVLPFVFVLPSPADLGLMALCGVCGGLALLCLLGAFRIAPVPVVAPFQYMEILWGLLYGALIFGDRPEGGIVLGAAVVILSGLYLIRLDAVRAPS